MRVVSLVPSLTEAVRGHRARPPGRRDRLLHPPRGLDVARVGGSKYPSIEKILATEPDLVLMNEEENRLADARHWSRPASGCSILPAYGRRGFADLRRLFVALLRPVPEWLVEVRRPGPGRRPRPRRR